MAHRPKISVVGAGNVGATVAQYVVERELGDVVLVDIIDGIPQGKALDLSQAGPVHRDLPVLTRISSSLSSRVPPESPQWVASL